MARRTKARTVAPELEWVPVERCIALRRNPQYLTPHTMDALKASIARDGFLAPVLLRPLAGSDGDYEVVSGNHRVMAARELGMPSVPAVVSDMDDASAQRVAVNLNTVHGDPTAELLAPFLAEVDDDVLATIHLSDAMLDEVSHLDADLEARLASLEAPPGWDRDSVNTPTKTCTCEKCGRTHIVKEPVDE